MNEREKKLIFVLFGAAFLIVNIFLFSSYQAVMQKKDKKLSHGDAQLKLMNSALENWQSQAEDVQWLEENPPAVGNHEKIGAELATYMEQSAVRHQVKLKKRPSPQRAIIDEGGDYRTTRAKVTGNAMDKEIYRWLTDLQDPEQNRSITSLHISPQRDDPTRVDCELEVTQWFTPEAEED